MNVPHVASENASLSERRRVARHIRRAEYRARGRDVSRLTHVQRLVRALLLDALAEYRRAGRFPKNPDFPWAVPSFVDARGTRCAMGFLMDLGGAGEVVRKISRESNYAFVRELALQPEIAAWLEAAGLSVDEAAAIQPSYCQTAYSDCVCEEHWSSPWPKADGVLEVTGLRTEGTVHFARIEALYGDALGYAVGGEVQVRNVVDGERALVPLVKGVDAGQGWGLEALPLDATGRPSACSRNDLPVSKQQAADALLSPSCKAAMAKVDARWDARPSCGDGGCNASGAQAADPSVPILLAVVGAIAAMRRARR